MTAWIYAESQLWSRIAAWFAGIKSEFVLNFITKNRWRMLLNGLGTTLLITLFSCLMGIAIGVVVSIVRSTWDKTGADMRPGFSRGLLRVLNRIAVTYGTSALAAINVSNRITMFMTSACLGFGQGFQPVAGYNFGADSKPRTRQAFWFSTLFGTVVCVAGAALIALFPEQVMHFFRDDPEVTRIGRQALLYACAVMPVMAYSTYVNQLYQCLGFHQAATLLASCRNGLLYVPLILLLPGLLGLSGVAMSQPAADFLTFLVSIPFQIWFFRHKLRG